MEKLLKIGIVGCGAIGSSLAKIITSDFTQKAKLCALYDIDMQKVYRLSAELKLPKLAVLSIDELIRKVDLVVEATKSESSLEIAKKTLISGRDILIMSVGGILGYEQELRLYADEHKVKVFIPSGAICGIDGLKASSYSTIHKVILTTIKPPKAFIGVPYVLRRKIRLEN
ncbi:MAG: Gfo/Idh/MocA family oxidoreductase [Candidatus Omnitrophica bacterium]|nr:Gfo/Idh/MocA family oxidoreductase [Candidatus Omnitrophota bacterium]